MSSNVTYNVVISGVLPGNKPAAVARAVAPVLGLLPDEAVHLFNGVGHTVLQQAGLSEAASFQTELKALGVDASTTVYQEKPGAARPAPLPEAEAEVPAPMPEPVAVPAAEPRAPEADIAAQQAKPAAADYGEKDAAEEPLAAAQDAEDEIALDASLLDDAPELPETVPPVQSPESEETARTEPAAPPAKPRPAAKKKPASAKPKPTATKPKPAAAPPASLDDDLDALFDSDAATTVAIQAEPAAPTERTPTGAPVRRVAPGSNMLCLSCNTLQPRADQCPACGAPQSTGASAASGRRRRPPSLPQTSLVAAGAATAVAAGLRLAVAQAVTFNTAVFGLLTGCLVGAACGLTGGRGVKAGAASAGIALLGMLVATLLLPRPPVEQPQAPPQPDPAEVWSEEQAPQWYENALSDAETFMTIDGSADAVREFMVQYRYTLARTPEQVPEADQRYFYDVDAKDLSWIVRNQPDFETWRARMRNHLSGRQRVSLRVSTPLARPAPPPVSLLHLVFMGAGLAAAFLLGMLGLQRDKPAA